MLQSFASRLRMAFLNKITAMESRLQLLETRIRSADPRNILRRGYVLVLDGSGHVARGAAGHKPGDRLTMMYHDGSLGCVVESAELKNNISQ